jgi:hypothetical protein
MLAPLAGVMGLSSNPTMKLATSSGLSAESWVRPMKHVGVDSPGADAYGRDAVFAPLHRDCLGQPDHAVLRDVVGAEPRELLGAIDAGERCDIHDAALTATAHRDEGGSAAEEAAGQVGAERFLPDLAGGLLKRDPGQSPGGADQGCDRAGPLGGFEKTFHVAAPADVWGAESPSNSIEGS